LESSAERVSQYETREQSREDKGEDGERKNITASVESKREEHALVQYKHAFHELVQYNIMAETFLLNMTLFHDLDSNRE